MYKLSTARNESDFFITRSYYYERFSLVESPLSFLKINNKINYQYFLLKI